MKVSLSWLKEYVPVTLPVADLAEALTMAGLEVDSVADRFEWMSTVLVGRVTSVAPHPKADRLKLCQVGLGDRFVRVVCGAPMSARACWRPWPWWAPPCPMAGAWNPP